MTKSYLIGREYLEAAEAERGRVFEPDGWISVLLPLHSREEYLHQLAALNHAASSKQSIAAYQDRFLEQLPRLDAEAARAALSGVFDRRPRVLLARQAILRAMRLVLVPPVPSSAPDPAVVTLLAGFSPETAAILLTHLAADALAQEIRVTEPRLGGTSESLGMEMVANGVFNEPADTGNLLARNRLLWTEYGNKLAKVSLRAAPLTLLQEAAGLDLDDITALGFACYAHTLARQPGERVAFNGLTDVAVELPTINRFLGLFSTSADDLAAALTDCPKSWQMLPIQNRPILRIGDSLIVLDERYLIERITSGLYWLVHDHEKRTYGEQARHLWNQAYAEMTEARAEDQLRAMAPRLIGGGSTFFTEEDLSRAFPGAKNCDAGIDFGGDVLLAEVVSGTVKVPTREEADTASFRADTERLVLKKARQLDAVARSLLADPQPTISPITDPARRIFPIIICGGQYPINPVTVSYIDEQIASEHLFADARIRHLGLLDFEELEVCQALHKRDNKTITELLAEWQESEYRQDSFRNYIWSRYGGQNIGRPDDIQHALDQANQAIVQRLNPVTAADRTEPPTHPDQDK